MQPDKPDLHAVDTDTVGDAVDTDAAEAIAVDAPGARAEIPDPFDPAALRISQDFAASAGVEQVRVTVPVRRPGRQDFIRVHPSDEYQLESRIHPR